MRRCGRAGVSSPMLLLDTGESLWSLARMARLTVFDSLGEYAALVTADVLSIDDALKIVAGRAKLMGEKCVRNETGMLAVKMPPTELAQYIGANDNHHGLTVACHNR